MRIGKLISMPLVEKVEVGEDLACTSKLYLFDKNKYIKQSLTGILSLGLRILKVLQESFLGYLDGSKRFRKAIKLMLQVNISIHILGHTIRDC